MVSFSAATSVIAVVIRTGKFSCNSVLNDCLSVEELDVNYDHRFVIFATLCVTAICVALTLLALQVVPNTPGMPFAIHLLMLFGWVTGFYLSMTQILMRPLLRKFASSWMTEHIQIAHGFQVPIVVCGVGTWAVVKFIGWI